MLRNTVTITDTIGPRLRGSVLLPKGDFWLYTYNEKTQRYEMDSNTLNAIKTNYKKLKGSYTIITFACDQGFQGPQSSFNNIDDLSSLAQFDTYQINTLYEAKKIIPYAINKRGFKIISIGQRLSGQEIYSENPTHISKNYSFLNTGVVTFSKNAVC